jgi:menaquinone-9 beta-reductase
MITSEVIIVGGGPAGSTCAWKLRQAGVETLVLDRSSFPRPKPCAGWITPRVLRHLEIDEHSYPYAISRYSRFYLHFPRFTLPLPTRQYAIRRIEFDDWLLKRSAAPVHTHTVREIRKEGGYFLIDEAYRCRVLVGAGGSSCPVSRTFFSHSYARNAPFTIAAIEAEFPAEVADRRCHLWFSEKGLPGYSWCVAKENGYVNIGVGGYAARLKQRGENIRQHWESLVERLISQSLLEKVPGDFRGYSYAIRHDSGPVQSGNCYILGDAAGLATRDMGEGIGPAVESGILAARAIAGGSEYSVRSIRHRSIQDILLPSAL